MNVVEVYIIANSHQSHKSCRKYKFENRANTDLKVNQISRFDAKIFFLSLDSKRQNFWFSTLNELHF
jgi:hypothetical protein